MVRLLKQSIPGGKRPLDGEMGHPKQQMEWDFPDFVIFYVTLYAAFGALSPFLPAFLQSHQLRYEEIGFVLGAGTAVRLIAGPAAGRVADRMQCPRMVFAVCTT